MTLKELMDRVLAMLPDAMFDETGDGEVIVMTGKRAHPEEDWNEGSLPLQPILDD
jgi:hypothetical protein